MKEKWNLQKRSRKQKGSARNRPCVQLSPAFASPLSILCSPRPCSRPGGAQDQNARQTAFGPLSLGSSWRAFHNRSWVSGPASYAWEGSGRDRTAGICRLLITPRPLGHALGASIRPFLLWGELMISTGIRREIYSSSSVSRGAKPHGDSISRKPAG